MRHNWDVHTNIEADVCTICGLNRRMRALMKGLNMISSIQFREYWVNGKWIQPHELGTMGRACPGKKTDYNHINIQTNEKNPNGALVIPINRGISPDNSDKGESN